MFKYGILVVAALATACGKSSGETEKEITIDGTLPSGTQTGAPSTPQKPSEEGTEIDIDGSESPIEGTIVDSILDAKSVFCANAGGDKFFIKFPNITFQNEKTTYGTVTYGFKGKLDSQYKTSVFTTNQQGVFNVWGNHALSLVLNSKPVAYFEWGYPPDSFETQRAAGDVGVWYQSFERNSNAYSYTCSLYGKP